jgi:hypothetical protein
MSDHDRRRVENLEWSRGLLAGAAVLAFLGLRYHPSNLERILSDKHRHKQGLTEIYGCRKDIFYGESPAILRAIPDVQLGDPTFEVLDCLRNLPVLKVDW